MGTKLSGPVLSGILHKFHAVDKSIGPSRQTRQSSWPSVGGDFSVATVAGFLKSSSFHKPSPQTGSIYFI